MGKKEISIIECLRNRARFADLCNAKLYEGKQIIRPEELELVDSRENLILPTKDGKNKGIERAHDLAMRWRRKVLLMIIPLEHQSKVHYAMPVRKMLTDGLVYIRQIQELYENRGDKEYTEEEFLSRFRKEDKLIPVIPIVFSCGLEEWDASTDVHGMIDWSLFEERTQLKRLVPNYHFNLVDINDDSYIDKLSTDLQILFSVVKYKKNKKKIKEYITNSTIRLPRDIYYAIVNVFGLSRLPEEVLEKKESDDMSNALLELIEDERMEGRNEERQNLFSLIQAMAENGERDEIVRLATDVEFFRKKQAQYQIGDGR